MGRGISQEFPNPNRQGCPSLDVLKSIASHRMPLAQAEKFLDHITSCSPCYADISRLREAERLRRTRSLVAVAACILFVALAALWAYLHNHAQVRLAQTAVLDLRDRSVTRGGSQTTEPSSGEAPLQLSRGASALKIYLPKDSAAGSYEVRILRSSGESLFVTNGIAKTGDGSLTTQVPVDLSDAHPGLYLLQVRKTGSEWSSYPIALK